MKVKNIEILNPFSYAIKKNPIITLYNIDKVYLNGNYCIIKLGSSHIYLYKNIVIAERVGINKGLIDNLVIDNPSNYTQSDLYSCYERPKQAIKDGINIANNIGFEIKCID